jgi:TPR repeat protein
MYARGQGVPVDEKEAAKWYQMAAEQGDSTAQFLLATAYLKGAGVEKDDVHAYMWLAIAAATGEQQAQASANSAKQQLGRRMNPAQISQAEDMAKQWLAKSPVR